MTRWRELTLLAGALALASALGSLGAGVRALEIAALGLGGAGAVALAGRRRARWPRLKRALGRSARLDDDRLWPLLDAAEDALVAIARDGRGFRSSLSPVGRAVIDLSRHAVALGAIRTGHEATLAGLALEPEPTALEREARTEVERVNAELAGIRRALGSVGPSVRHLKLLTRAGEAGAAAGETPLELEERLLVLRQALAQEMAS